MSKKKWKRPELIILVHKRPEEAILLDCKATTGGGLQSGVDGGCEDDFGGGYCVKCDSVVAS